MVTGQETMEGLSSCCQVSLVILLILMSVVTAQNKVKFLIASLEMFPVKHCLYREQSLVFNLQF